MKSSFVLGAFAGHLKAAREPFAVASAIAVAVLCICISSCSGMLKPDVGGVPSIGNVTSSVSEQSVVLGADVENRAAVSESGFCWGEGDASSRVPVKVDDDGTLSASLNGLKPKTTYVFYAYVGNGIDEFRSELHSFTTEALPPPPVPPEDEPVYFADSRLKDYLVWRYDTNGDGEISVKEGEAIDKIIVSIEGLESVVGVERLPELFHLSVSAPDVQDPLNPLPLSKVDVTRNLKLSEIELMNTKVAAIDLSKNTQLTYIGLYACPVTSLDISANTLVTLFGAGFCQLDSIDLHLNKALEEVHLDNNRLKKIVIGELPALMSLDCSCNQLTELDISGCKKLYALDCLENPNLKRIYMKKGQVLGSLRTDSGVEIIYK